MIGARQKIRRKGLERDFLKEIIKDVRVRGREIGLSYRLPTEPTKSSARATHGGFLTVSGMVEAGGIEPPSEGLPPEMTTCLAIVLVSLLEPPTARFLGAIRFGSRPHPPRQENQPIPLNDVLSSPVGESR